MLCVLCVLCCWQRDLNKFAREEPSLRVMKEILKAGYVKATAYSSRPFQTVLIQTHHQTSCIALKRESVPVKATQDFINA